MKIITRTRKTGEYLGYYILEDNEEVKVQEFEELPHKENHYVETYFDDKEKLVKQKYVEIPKTKEQELEEKILRLEKALVEKEPNLDELKDLEKMKAARANKINVPSAAELSELENI